MWSDFKKFLFRGNIVTLAVGVVIGTAFTAIVTSLVNDIIMPVIGMITGGYDFSTLYVYVGDAKLMYGLFIAAIINFILIALVIFFIIKLMYKITKTEEKEARKCPYCCTEIDDAATRCPNCTSMLDVEESD